MSRPPLQPRAIIKVPAMRADGRPAYANAPEPVRAPITMRDWQAQRHNRPSLLARLRARISPDTRSQREIAADFGVTQRVIWSVKNGLTWGHVQ